LSLMVKLISFEILYLDDKVEPLKSWVIMKIFV